METPPANAAIALPQFRSDLVLGQRGSKDGVVAKLPESGRHFSLGQVEYWIACQLDGRTPLETIRERYRSVRRRRFQVSSTRYRMPTPSPYYATDRQREASPRCFRGVELGRFREVHRGEAGHGPAPV